MRAFQVLYVRARLIALQLFGHLARKLFFARLSSGAM